MEYQKSRLAILVDQKYGAQFLVDAREQDIITCVPVEKSGQNEFGFEVGDDFRQHIKEATPIFTKALVPYNPDGDAGVHENPRRGLKALSVYSHATGHRFRFEHLAPATESQLEFVAEVGAALIAPSGS